MTGQGGKALECLTVMRSHLLDKGEQIFQGICERIG